VVNELSVQIDVKEMRIAIMMTAPADVYFYGIIAKELERHGHDVSIFIRDYGNTRRLAELMNLNNRVFSKPPVSRFGKIFSAPLEIILAIKSLREFKPNIVLGGGFFGALPARFHNAKFIEFLDGEPGINLFYSIQRKCYAPFVNKIITPTSFIEDLGPKHLRVNSFKELGYLKPGCYNPNENIFELLGIGKDNDFIVIRFNAFDAVHDIGISSMIDEKIKMVNELAEKTRVFLSCEGDIPRELERYELKIPMNRIHDVLFYAKLVITETGTMTTEAACLGTPVILIHPKARSFGNFRELEDRYGLIFTFEENLNKVQVKALELLRDPNTKSIWKEKLAIMLNDKVDFVDFIIRIIE